MWRAIIGPDMNRELFTTCVRRACLRDIAPLVSAGLAGQYTPSWQTQGSGYDMTSGRRMSSYSCKWPPANEFTHIGVNNAAAVDAI